ncbi:hypothetical protein PV433_31080 [Paenibacillus sp. GYB004]|uniref:hypothetical protein n=1 Tax=Paenibacillus sp. GYB004 TaxID=2994393 RepID=UPI002F965B0B
MQQTPNYSLKKPDPSDYYNVQNQNDNMDIIDGALSEKLPTAGGKMTGPIAFVDDGIYMMVDNGNGMQIINKLASTTIGSNGVTYITNNAYYNGSAGGWLRINTSNPASMLVTTEGGLRIYTAAAGANPITWTDEGLAVTTVPFVGIKALHGVLLPNNVAIVGTYTDAAKRPIIYVSIDNGVVVGNTASVTTIHSALPPRWWNGTEDQSLIHGNTGVAQTIRTELTVMGRLNTNPTIMKMEDTDSALSSPLEIRSDGPTNDPYMSLHSAGNFAINFGMDATSKRLQVGGWSMGESVAMVWDERSLRENTQFRALQFLSAVDSKWYDVGVVRGTGSPEGVVTALIGAIYVNESGGANTTFWVKETGSGNTGWKAK